MDHRLVTWARAVKARQRRKPQHRSWRRRRGLPVLWLFTDAARMPDPLGAIAALPRGLCGVVFRHDGVAGRASLAQAVARQCRIRDVALVVAGDVRLALALGAGVHLRDGRPFSPPRRLKGLLTSSAHSRAELRRARMAGVDAAFLSPWMPTSSHPGSPALGAVRWAALARQSGGSTMALGGVEGRVVRRLPRWCRGIGAITALLDGGQNV